MGLFKNEVGRPSNETLKKRRILLLVVLLVVAAGIGACVFYTVSYFTGEKVEGTNKNLSSGYLDLTNGIQVSSSNVIYENNTALAKKKYFMIGESHVAKYIIEMDTSARLVFKTQYSKQTRKGKTINKKTYYYQVQVLAYDSNDKVISSTGKANIKTKTISQSLNITNKIAYLKLKIYDASNAKDRTVVETHKFTMTAKTPKVTNPDMNDEKNIAKTFTDEQFRNCVLKAYNTANKTSKKDLTDKELKTIKTLNCQSRNISNITGIDKLTALTNLNLKLNAIAKINLEKNTELSKVDVSNNSIVNINITSAKSLKELDVSNNQLQELDVTHNSLLEKLNASNNQLQELNVSNNSLLGKINASNNQMGKINLNGDTALTELNVSVNKLEKVDVSNNANLKILKATNNNITSINVANNNLLKTLEIYKGNKINRSGITTSNNQKVAIK